jgi:hypothetical protein
MAKAVLSNKGANKTKSITLENYSITKIVPETRVVKINDVLPFRIKFINIGIEGYSSTNPPPIPLQVIGYSNYIL